MNPNAAFAAVLMVIVGYAVWEAQSWDMGTRTFPTLIGSVLFLLIAVQLILSLRAGRRPVAVAIPVDESTALEEPAARRRRRAFILWLLGFGFAIWLLSFPVGGTLATLAYLKSNHERWRTTLAITAGTWAFFWLLTNVLNVFFPRGLILDLVAR